jgi:hypothetical protein
MRVKETSLVVVSAKGVELKRGFKDHNDAFAWTVNELSKEKKGTKYHIMQEVLVTKTAD